MKKPTISAGQYSSLIVVFSFAGNLTFVPVRADASSRVSIQVADIKGFFNDIKEGIKSIGDTVKGGKEVVEETEELGETVGSKKEKNLEPATTAEWSEKIQETQFRLQNLGFNPGPIDGIFGAKTQSAIRSFQKIRGLPQDGKVSTDLLAELRAIDNTPYEPSTGTESETQGATAQQSSSSSGSAVSKEIENWTGFQIGESGQVILQDSGAGTQQTGTQSSSPPAQEPGSASAAGSLPVEEKSNLSAGSCFPRQYHHIRRYAKSRGWLSGLIDACESGGHLEGRNELQSTLAPLTPPLLSQARNTYEESYQLWHSSSMPCGTATYANDVDEARKGRDVHKRLAETVINRWCVGPGQTAATGTSSVDSTTKSTQPTGSISRADYPTEPWLNPAHEKYLARKGMQLAEADAVVTYCTGQREEGIRQDYVTIMKVNFPAAKGGAVDALYDNNFNMKLAAQEQNQRECGSGQLHIARHTIEMTLASIRPSTVSDEFALAPSKKTSASSSTSSSASQARVWCDQRNSYKAGWRFNCDCVVRLASDHVATGKNIHQAMDSAYHSDCIDPGRTAEAIAARECRQSNCQCVSDQLRGKVESIVRNDPGPATRKLNPLVLGFEARRACRGT